MRDVLHGVLHSILFHRLFGTIKPQTFEVLDVTMVRGQLILRQSRSSIFFLSLAYHTLKQSGSSMKRWTHFGKESRVAVVSEARCGFRMLDKALIS